jgi:hypothetical protein
MALVDVHVEPILFTARSDFKSWPGRTFGDTQTHQ